HAPRCRPLRRRVEASLPLPVAWPHVCQTEWRRLPVLPKLHAGWRAPGQPGTAIPHADLEFGHHAADAHPSCRGTRRRGGYLLPLLHHHPPSGSRHWKPPPARPHRPPLAPTGRAPGLPLQTPPPPAPAPAPLGGPSVTKFFSLVGRTPRPR